MNKGSTKLTQAELQAIVGHAFTMTEPQSRECASKVDAKSSLTDPIQLCLWPLKQNTECQKLCLLLQGTCKPSILGIHMALDLSCCCLRLSHDLKYNTLCPELALLLSLQQDADYLYIDTSTTPSILQHMS